MGHVRYQREKELTREILTLSWELQNCKPAEVGSLRSKLDKASSYKNILIRSRVLSKKAK